ncbi:MAG: hypothetical protein HC923_11665 [Myxococcales bacterium]|nr:hypothetical protein [Myxococcales bacterium]
MSSGGFTAERERTLSVLPPSLPLTITTRTMPPALVGEPYAETVGAVGGTLPLRFTATNLPQGFTLSTTGRLTGVAAFDFATFARVQVEDAVGEREEIDVGIVAIDPNQGIEIGIADLPNALVDSRTISRSPVRGADDASFVALRSAPRGLTFDAASGRLFGVPELAGAFPVILEARSPGGSFDRNPFVLVVLEAGDLQISTEELPTARLDQPYRTTGGDDVRILVRGNEEGRELTWMVGAGQLPPGLVLEGDTIRGTPTELGTSAFTVFVIDTTGDSATRFFGLSVDDGAPGGSSSGCRCAPLAPQGAAPGWALLAGMMFAIWLLAPAQRRRRS